MEGRVGGLEWSRLGSTDRRSEIARMASGGGRGPVVILLRWMSQLRDWVGQGGGFELCGWNGGRFFHRWS